MTVFLQVWQPGIDSIGEGEDLQYDPTTYDCMHQLTLDWPCMRWEPLTCQSACCDQRSSSMMTPCRALLSCSFDIVKDKLGGPRSTFPHNVTIVAGTQAASAKSNYIALMRFSNVTQVC